MRGVAHRGGQQLNAGTRLLVLGLVLVAGAGPSPARASEEAKNAEEVSLPPTLITEGATPATELEATFTMAKSAAERGYGFGFSSIQYAPIPSFGLKLIVPFAVRDPQDTKPTVAGIGDVGVMVKYAPVLLPAQQFALSGGLTVTFPTGSERRGLGGGVGGGAVPGGRQGARSVQPPGRRRLSLAAQRPPEARTGGGGGGGGEASQRARGHRQPDDDLFPPEVAGAAPGAEQRDAAPPGRPSERAGAALSHPGRERGAGR